MKEFILSFFKDDSLFGHESEQQFVINILDDNGETFYDGGQVSITFNKLKRVLEDNDITIDNDTYRYYDELYSYGGEHHFYREHKEQLMKAWKAFKIKCKLRGKITEYSEIIYDYRDRKPKEEVMNLDTYMFIFEGGKREE